MAVETPILAVKAAIEVVLVVAAVAIVKIDHLLKPSVQNATSLVAFHSDQPVASRSFVRPVLNRMAAQSLHSEIVTPLVETVADSAVDATVISDLIVPIDR